MKKIQRFLIITLIFILGISLGGCKKNVGTPEDNPVKEESEDETQTEEKEQTVIGFSVIDMANPFYKALENSIKEEADRAGDTFISKDSKGDANIQAANIAEMIQEGINVLVLTPVDNEAITESLKALKEAKVKVINVDSKVKETKYVEAFIGSDNDKAGELLAEETMKRFPNGGKVAILESQAQNSVVSRITSYESGLTKAEKGFEVVERKDAGGDQESAKAAALEMLANHGDIDVFICGNDEMAFGVQSAVNEKNVTGIKIFSIDGSPTIKAELLNPESSITATVAQAPITMGKTTFSVLESIVEGKEFESESTEPVYLVTEENVDVYGTDGWK
ncbi:MAG TPA: substrate-binding domain-containing protein [Candidatus Dorea intestinavium]|nr:substrate-binding domain-containing protein [Candidatus Dorea intestinavium]